jgi:uncharacterized protein
MHIGVLRIHFRLFSARSLKDKRQVLQSIKGRIQSRFNVSVAEIGSQDLWNAGELGVAMIGSDHRYVNGAMEKIFSFIESNPEISVIEHDIEII